MAGNAFGKLFSVTTYGESHGEAIGCIVDGCPPNIELNENDIQLYAGNYKLHNIEPHQNY